ncbi:MAG: type II secretion system protein J [Phycisphaerae bacterium]
MTHSLQTLKTRYGGTPRLGFTLVELLVSLAILAVVLTAAATFVHATLYNYDQNEKIASNSHLSRMILTRLNRQIRTAAAVSCTNSSVTIVPPNDGSGLQQIKYYVHNRTLWYQQKINGEITSHPLIAPEDDITLKTFTVGTVMGYDWNDVYCVKTVTIRLEVQQDEHTHSFTVTASPRRNQV